MMHGLSAASLGYADLRPVLDVGLVEDAHFKEHVLLESNCHVQGCEHSLCVCTRICSPEMCAKPNVNEVDQDSDEDSFDEDVESYPPIARAV